ncbi:MAG TPA: hypothetical protein PKE04_11465 [Clostridia bacterium]|nr:hypothetical protein [Clostridia bacterium]
MNLTKMHPALLHIGKPSFIADARAAAGHSCCGARVIHGAESVESGARFCAVISEKIKELRAGAPNGYFTEHATDFGRVGPAGPPARRMHRSVEEEGDHDV